MINAESLPTRVTAPVDSLTFKKTQRLLTGVEYQQVFKKGRKQHGQALTLFTCKNGLTQARLGLAIAKKHLRKAVSRNKARRIVRESFRHYQSQLVGLDIVVIAQASIGKIDLKELHKDLQRQWQHLFHCQKSYC